MSHTKREISRAAGIMGIFTLASRITGLIREGVVAYLFGAGMTTDAFFVAFRIPNLFRRLLAEGSLTVAFIPVFSEYRASHTEDETRKMVHAVFSVAVAFLIAFVVLGILFSPLLIRIFAPGFVVDPQKFNLTVLLNRVMFPYLLLVSLMALAMGVLNSVNHFSSPAFAPVLLNLSMIAIPFLCYSFFVPPIISLGVAVLVGGMFQYAIQIRPLEKVRLGFRWRWDPRHPGVHKIFRLMGPSVFGTAVYQLNILITTFMASWLQEGAISYLWYSGRVFEVIQGVFVIAIATATLPTLSRKVAQKDRSGVEEALSYSLRMVLWVTIPASVGLVLLAQPISKVLFERGLFTAAMTEKTASALWAYALGLAPLGAVRVLVQSFYAYQEMKAPVWIAFYTFLLNLILSVVLMFPMQHTGLALATTLSVFFQLALLTRSLHKRYALSVWSPLGKWLLKTLSIASVMGLSVWGATSFLNASTPLGLLGVIGLGVLVFIALNKLFRSEELGELKQYLLKKN